MDENLQDLIQSLLISLVLIGGGFYIKIAKHKEPYAGKNLWKITIGIGIIGFLFSLIKYMIID